MGELLLNAVSNNGATKWTAANSFVTNPLKVPNKAIRVADGPDGEWQYKIFMREIPHRFHPQLHPVRVWTFASKRSDATWPGETVEALVGQPLRVTWVNDLDTENLNSLMNIGVRQSMEETHMLTKSHNQVHLHGARVPWTSDGSPMHVFHGNEQRGYYYPNNQAAATMWYHDHTMDVTRLNVYAGLCGMYFLRKPSELTKLPKGAYEIPLVLGDKSFSHRGPAGSPLKLEYQQVIDLSDPAGPDVTPEFIGDYPVVNGSIWPTQTVRPTVYRYRIVNGANTRYFNMRLIDEANPAADPLKFHVVGSDGGFLNNVESVDSLMLAPGERADVLVDFRGPTGRHYILTNDAEIPYSGGLLDPANADDRRCAELMRITVAGAAVAGSNKFAPTTVGLIPARVDPLPHGNLDQAPALPAVLTALDSHILATEGVNPPLVPIVGDAVTIPGATPFTFRYRRFVLEENQLTMPTLDGVAPPTPNNTGITALTNVRVPTVLINGKSGPDTDALQVERGDYELWEFVNLTPDSHPMHVHLVQFRLAQRLAIDVKPDDPRITPDLPEPKRADGYGAVTYPLVAGTSDPESGWKDTIRCANGEVTRIFMRFDGYTGEYVYHCHILEHEDMGMMFNINVEEPAP
jgi:spore coat protein A, manganese oxidase